MLKEVLVCVVAIFALAEPQIYRLAYPSAQQQPLQYGAVAPRNGIETIETVEVGAGKILDSVEDGGSEEQQPSRKPRTFKQRTKSLRARKEQLEEKGRELAKKLADIDTELRTITQQLNAQKQVDEEALRLERQNELSRLQAESVARAARIRELDAKLNPGRVKVPAPKVTAPKVPAPNPPALKAPPPKAPAPVQSAPSASDPAADDLAELKGAAEPCDFRDEERVDIARMHNSFRSEIASGDFVGFSGQFPAATDMRNLTYDCGLENSAQKVADRCDIKFSFIKGVGENIATINTPASGDQVLAGKGRQATISWQKQFQDFDIKDHDVIKLDYDMLSHSKVKFAAQMAWAKTSKIGCGAALCDENKRALVICHYREKGRVAKANIYTKARTVYDAGSDCPPGTVLNDNTKLCD